MVQREDALHRIHIQWWHQHQSPLELPTLSLEVALDGRKLLALKIEQWIVLFILVI